MAGQGRDLIGVLAQHPGAARVRAELIEYDSRNVAVAQAGIAAAGLVGISVTQADAGDFAAYRTAIPADLVLLAGVLGNVSDDDVHATIHALPRLCAPGADGDLDQDPSRSRPHPGSPRLVRRRWFQ